MYAMTTYSSFPQLKRGGNARSVLTPTDFHRYMMMYNIDIKNSPPEATCNKGVTGDAGNKYN